MWLKWILAELGIKCVGPSPMVHWAGTIICYCDDCVQPKHCTLYYVVRRGRDILRF